jgi:hypothetical protein
MKHGMPKLAMSVALAFAPTLILGGSAAVAAIPHSRGSWSIQGVPSPAGASNVALNGISCLSRTLCIAVGGSSLGTLAEGWNGTAWSILSATACIAVGSAGGAPLAEAHSA